MNNKIIAFIAGSIILPIATSAFADDGYQTPSKSIASIVDAKLAPSTRLSPDKQWMAFFERQRIASLDELAKPELKLAGIKLNPDNFSRARPRSKYLSIAFQHLKTDKKITIDNLPKGRILSPSWSPNSEHLAFFVEQAKEANLFIYSINTDTLQKVKNLALNSVITSRPYRWLPDSSAIIANKAVNITVDAPQDSAASAIPIVSQTTGEKAPARTYQNLLATPHDKALFKYYGLGQLVKVSLKGDITKVGEPALIRAFRSSPDAKHLLVGHIQQPFSYLVPYSRFATSWQVIDTNGKLVKEIVRQPLAENIPQGFDSVRTGKRSLSWRDDKPATLVWAEAQDKGSMKTEVEFHDFIYTQAAPFTESPTLFAKLDRRYSGITWGNDQVAMLSDWRFSDRKVRTFIINPNNADKDRIIFEDRSYNDAYNDPGNVVQKQNAFGRYTLSIQDDRYLLLTGIGASDQGNIPFLDKYDITTQKKERLWHSEAPYYERVRGVLDDTGTKLITIRESKTEQPNFFIRDLTKKSITQFSDFPHPYPTFTSVKKELVKYTRDDGVELSGTLYLPPGYKKSDGTLPVLMWAYPLEYKDKTVASQVRESPYEFTYIGYWGPMPYLAKGIAIFDDPKMPIVGIDGKEPNDTFRKQLVSSAKAAVDVLVEKGVADKENIAIAGHSYGAFMVANLLAHSDLFKTGIARSGAYNRSLTPFGFQGEERNFWEGQNVYATMSPFFHAEKINEPMLMIHGKEDPNSGTFPMQSERMYNALKGLGKDARLVMLPYEGHGYRARESILHVLWEQERWLENKLIVE
ncbi:prolyl oligopeptidase family serine peptidase [Thalassotalea sp. 1_MG-2023]|uniref:alpha/beta hydrolase family protein n=1 Tax=Thalassotalea sp. 1_MG-2023 TaxID=3062680 RepID=UPI0026E482FA|nr:prolyl oligopeptidase family serine peptidase [Thalassotalea sp. 1_MG-2023]MDO6426361.1 prolyl oligopeptidase family serine peptidase [Thalassotalea sp. 1_MG-2023]